MCLWLAMNCHSVLISAISAIYMFPKCSVKKNHRKNWIKSLLTSKGQSPRLVLQSSHSGVTASTSIRPLGLTAQATLSTGPGSDRIWLCSRLSKSSENRRENKKVSNSFPSLSHLPGDPLVTFLKSFILDRSFGTPAFRLVPRLVTVPQLGLGSSFLNHFLQPQRSTLVLSLALFSIVQCSGTLW